MAEHLQNALDRQLAKQIANSVEERLDAAGDLDEQISVLKAYAAAALFSYAELVSMAAAADWLRKSADHFDSLAARQKGEMN